MDAVELPFPATVAVSKLLTAEGFSRAVGVTAGEPEARESNCVSIFGSTSVTGCSSSCSVIASKQNSISQDKRVGVELSMHESQLPSFVGESIAKQISCKDNNSPLSPKCGDKQLQRKARNMSRSRSPCSKRTRTEQVEGSLSQAGDDSNVISGKLGSNLTKCTFAEKSRAVKQKHSLDAKRGDKRNFKAPTKTKTDSFISKAGLMNSNSAAGGNNILGIYGLKSDTHDITKHVDELSLNELLDGSYKCPSLCQNKGKKAANTNENILHLVRKACSILQLRRPAESQNAVEVDSSNKKTSAFPLSSGLCIISSTDCDKGDNYMADLASSSKDLCNKPCVPANMIDSTLYQPKDILERLALPPAKDLDSLLLDTAKVAASSRNTPDLCSGKPISYRASLPPFPWSQSFGGSCKTNIDMGKLTANRSTCQGRWVRIGSIASFSGDNRSCFSDLDSLTYDHSLVPSEGLKSDPFENEKAHSTPVRLPRCEQVSSSSATVTCPSTSHVPCKTISKGSGATSSQRPLESNLLQRRLDSLNAHMKLGLNNGIFLNTQQTEDPLANSLPSQENENNCFEKKQSERRNHDSRTDSGCYSPFKCSVVGCNQLVWHVHTPENSKQAGHSPRLLAAAQTLCEIASQFRKQNQSNGNFSWPKKSSQKAMKARKSRSSAGKEGMSVTPKSVTEPGDQAKIADQIMPSKKPKFSLTNNKTDIGHTNNVGTGLIKWSTPTSSRSSPSKLEWDSVANTKQSPADIVKLLGMIPPATRVLDKAFNSQSKPRKPVAMDWGRGRNKEG